MRIKLTERDRKRLFSGLEKKSGNLKTIAMNIGVSQRTLRDWRKGKFFMPVETFEKLVTLAGLREKIIPAEILPNFWNTQQSARMGGFTRVQLHGNPGTPEGRRKGGSASIVTHH